MPENFQRGLAREKSEAFDYTRHYAPLSPIHKGMEPVVEPSFAVGQGTGQPRQVGRHGAPGDDRSFVVQLLGDNEGLFGHRQA
jgi:hypothetical protein